MLEQTKIYYEKRAQVLMKNLRSRHFEAHYCATREEALAKALELIPKGSSVTWGGSMTTKQMGLRDALKAGDYRVLDRDEAKTLQERELAMKKAFLTDVYVTSTNALSLDGQMVNVDGMANRVAAIAYGPDSVIVVTGMNKVVDTLEDAMTRARTLAAPTNAQRFDIATPCKITGACGDCKSADSICSQILVTRNCRPAGRIKIILIGEELGF